MELDFLWLIVAGLLGGCGFVFWFLKRVNEWYYVGRLGKTACPLPPGDMGWSLLGNMLSLFKSLRAGDPNSHIYNLVSRYGKTGIYKTHIFGSPSIIVCRPELCRRVLTNDEHFRLGYPKSVFLLTGSRSLHNISIAEHRRLRRLIAGPINGLEALEFYIQHTEALGINSLDEWGSMKHPFELLTELKRSTFKNSKGKAGAFTPFGEGSRFCPGSVLAKLVIIIFLHYFLLNYKLKRLNPESPLRFTQGPIPADNCLVEVIRIP